MSDIRITSDARDNAAQEYYDLWETVVKPEYDVKPETPVDAPYTNNADQPSYYPPGTLPVVSDARHGYAYTKGEWSWTLKTVPEGALDSYGLDDCPIPDYARCGWKVDIIQRGDWQHWEFNMGQHKILHRADFTRAAYVQSHVTEPVILNHLDTRPIICQDHHQAQRECERVGKTILR